MADRVTLPEFEIVSSPTINISDVQVKRFDLLRGIPKLYRDILKRGHRVSATEIEPNIYQVTTEDRAGGCTVTHLDPGLPTSMWFTGLGGNRGIFNWDPSK